MIDDITQQCEEWRLGAGGLHLTGPRLGHENVSAKELQGMDDRWEAYGRSINMTTRTEPLAKDKLGFVCHPHGDPGASFTFQVQLDHALPERSIV